MGNAQEDLFLVPIAERWKLGHDDAYERDMVNPRPLYQDDETYMRGFLEGSRKRADELFRGDK